MDYCTRLLDEPQSGDKAWQEEVLEQQDHCWSDKGLAKEVDSGYVLVKFFETHSNLSKENPYYIPEVLDPVLSGKRTKTRARNSLKSF